MSANPELETILLEMKDKMKSLGNLLKTLEKIEKIVSDDFCHDLEHDLMKEKPMSEKEKTMIKKLEEVYRLAHGINPKHSCFNSHEDWRK